MPREGGPKFEPEPKKKPLKTALERAMERTENIEEVEGEPEENWVAEESIEQEGEEEFRRVEVEKGPAPWEKTRTEEEGRLIEEYAEKAQLSEKAKDSIENALKEEADRKRIEFAREWFSEHQDEIKEKGYDVRTEDEGYVIRVTSELGGFKELKSNKEYREKNEEIENFYALRADLQKENIPIESQFLMLNALNKRGERIAGELERAQATGDKEAVKAKELQLEELVKTSQELAEKVSGRDLRNEADKEIEKLSTKEEYIQNNFREKEVDEKVESKRQELARKAHQRWVKFSPWRKFVTVITGAPEENSTNDYLEELDLGMKEKEGIFFTHSTLYDQKGNKLGTFTSFKLEEFLSSKLKEKIEKEIKGELGNDWETKNQAREGEIKKLIEKEVKDLASSPENAEGEIEVVYGRVKERLITEFAEKDLKKKEKTKEELKTIEEEFKGKGKNPTEFIDNVIHRRGILRELTGDAKKDEEKITDFLEGWGISLRPGDLSEGRGYGEAVKKERGFLDWLLDFIFSYRPQETEKPKEGGKGGKKATKAKK